MCKQLSDFNLGDLFSLFIILYRFSTLDLLLPLPTFKNPCTTTITSNLHSIIQYKLHNLLKLTILNRQFIQSKFLSRNQPFTQAKRKQDTSLGMVAYAFNTSIWEAEVRGVPGQLGMHRAVSRTKIKKKQGNVSSSFPGLQCTITLMKYLGEIEKIN